MKRIAGYAFLLFCASVEAAEPERLVAARTGTLPIILSVPHGGREAIPGVPPRAGEGVAQFATVRDEQTIELAEALTNRIEQRFGGRPYVVIARFDRKFVDPNRAEHSAIEHEKAKPTYRAFHTALEDFTKDVQKKWKRGLLLDIHGQSGIPDALVRGTNDGQTAELLVKRFGREALVGPKSLLGRFAGAGFKVVPDVNSTDPEDKRYLGGYIVRTYGSHQGNGIDAIQLEFGSDLRKKANLPKTASALAEAVELFCREYLLEAVRK